LATKKKIYRKRNSSQIVTEATPAIIILADLFEQNWKITTELGAPFIPCMPCPAQLGHEPLRTVPRGKRRDVFLDKKARALRKPKRSLL
jgi:hypothetical protein